MSKKVIITGGCGFVGHHIVEHYLKNSDYDIIIFDKLSYSSSGFDRVRDIEAFDSTRVSIFTLDLIRPIPEGVIQECIGVSDIIHIAAESHVDRSIEDPMTFVKSNVVGTVNLLLFTNEIRKRGSMFDRFVYFSTDEVFGPAPGNIFYKENDSYNSCNPYSASKASAEQFCIAFNNCYHIPMIITRSMNIFGERQHPEKFIPLCINKILADEIITIHASPDCKVSGSRFYIHARNVAHAIDFIMKRPTHMGCEAFNIVGENEISNLMLANMIGDIIGKKAKTKMVDFHSSRPGHDLRYALDGSKMKSIGWKIPMNLKNSIEKTIKWYLNRPEWLKSS